MADDDNDKVRGYHGGDVDSVISVEEVTRQAAAIAEDISIEQLDELAGNQPHVSINNLVAGRWKSCIISTCMSARRSRCV